MAKEKIKEPKVVLERTYNVPLRKEWLKAPKWKRAKKAQMQWLNSHFQKGAMPPSFLA